jgi:hypothetical protein
MTLISTFVALQLLLTNCIYVESTFYWADQARWHAPWLFE